MAFPSKDGSQWTAPTMARLNDRRIDARNEAKPKQPAQMDSQADGQTPPIEDNPEAMKLVDALKQMGYTADDVAQAMGGDEQSQDMQGSDNSGQDATHAASLNIPGIR